jgi:choline dehydrogenase
MMGYEGKTITTGSGFFADVGVCRPTSRGRLKLTARDPHQPPQIDLGVLSDPADLAILLVGFKKLSEILDSALFTMMAAPEIFTAHSVVTDDEIENYARAAVPLIIPLELSRWAVTHNQSHQT